MTVISLFINIVIIS